MFSLLLLLLLLSSLPCHPFPPVPPVPHLTGRAFHDPRPQYNAAVDDGDEHQDDAAAES